MIKDFGVKTFLKLSYVSMFRTISLVSLVGCAVAGYVDDNTSSTIGWAISACLYINLLYNEYLIHEYRRQAHEYDKDVDMLCKLVGKSETKSTQQ